MALQKKEIDMGYARALLALDDPQTQIKVFKEIIKNNYSVRKVEELIQQLKAGITLGSGKKAIKQDTALPTFAENARLRMTEAIGQNVRLTCNKNGKGKISIAFADEDELNRIIQALSL